MLNSGNIMEKKNKNKPQTLELYFFMLQAENIVQIANLFPTILTFQDLIF